MNYITNALFNFNLPFTLKSYNEYSIGYLITLTIDTPVVKSTFTDIALLISMLERKYTVVEFDSLNKDELTLYVVGGDDNWL